MNRREHYCEMGSPRRVVILGLGNVLMGDDGLGPRVIERLEAEYEFGRDVTLMDVGTPGLHLVEYLIDADVLIVIDVAKGDGRPGELHRYRGSQMLPSPPAWRLTAHDPGLKEALWTLQLHGRAPSQVLLLAVIPAKIEIGLGLSPRVQEAIPLVIAAVVQEVKRWGIPVRKRIPSGETVGGMRPAPERGEAR